MIKSILEIRGSDTVSEIEYQYNQNSQVQSIAKSYFRLNSEAGTTHIINYLWNNTKDVVPVMISYIKVDSSLSKKGIDGRMGFIFFNVQDGEIVLRSFSRPYNLAFFEGGNIAFRFGFDKKEEYSKRRLDIFDFDFIYDILYRANYGLMMETLM